MTYKNGRLSFSNSYTEWQATIFLCEILYSID